LSVGVDGGLLPYPRPLGCYRIADNQGIPVKNISEKTKYFLDSISTIDDFGFQIRPHFYWLPESTEDEIERLELNLAMYDQYLSNGSRFSEKTNNARLDEFNRLKFLLMRAS
jgi:hypothetical protein